MSVDRWDQIKDVFEAARQIPPGEGRNRLLAEACGEDAELRAEIDSLLGSEDAAGDFLEQTPATLLAVDSATVTTRSGQRIGSCTLTSIIGAGGIGVVYAAVQDEPQRKVAVKLLRPGLATPSLLRRFKHEAEILARLQHPGITRIYEAGTHRSELGEDVPYFVMELIPEAQSLVASAERQGLTLRQRLELFCEVCAAVHYGHQKGVIHRDLKPSNILVDASGQPKVIDFGVARMTDVATSTLLTQVGQIIGTLQYMSPEQCDVDAVDIDLRSDVYSLGVVLYELLCQSVPYDLSDVPLARVAAVIQGQPPRRPTDGGVTLDEDLETIILKALEKDRDRRYASVDAFAADIERFLESRPILARRATVAYQLRLFSRRHKAVAGAVGATLVVLIAATIVSTVFYLRERDRARTEHRARETSEQLFEETRDLARWVIRSFYDELNRISGSLEVRLSLIDRMREHLERVSARAQDDPELMLEVARAWERLGDVQAGDPASNLGYFAAAHESYGRALKILERLHGSQTSSAELGVMIALIFGKDGDVSLSQGDSDTALAKYLEAERCFEDGVEKYPNQSRLHLGSSQSVRRIAAALAARGELKEARESYLKSVTRAEALYDPLASRQEVALNLAESHAQLAMFLASQSDPESALQHYERFLEIAETLNLEASSTPLLRKDFSHYLIVAGDFQYDQERYKEANESYRKAMTIRRDWAETSPADLRAKSALGVAYERMGWGESALGRFQDAERSFRACIDTREKLLAKDPTNIQLRYEVAYGHEKLAEVLVNLDREETSLAESRIADEMYQAILKDDDSFNKARLQDAFVTFQIAKLRVNRSEQIDNDRSLEEEIAGYAAARDWMKRSLALFERLHQDGALPEVHVHMPETLRQLIATCEETITELERD